MNKADLIDQVASETGSTKVDAAKALDAVVDAVTGALEPLTVTLTECQLSASPVLS